MCVYMYIHTYMYITYSVLVCMIDSIAIINIIMLSVVIIMRPRSCRARPGARSAR